MRRRVACAIIPLMNKQVLFSWSLVKRFFFNRRKKQIKVIMGDVYCQIRPNSKRVHFSTKNFSNFYDCKKWKSCPHLQIFLLRRKNRQKFVWWWRFILPCKKNESWLRKRWIISSFEEVFPPVTMKQSKAWTKKSENCSTCGIIVSTPHLQ